MSIAFQSTQQTKSSILLLNNEFHNDTNVTGFELYGALAGEIQIQVILSNSRINNIKKFNKNEH